jgi:hypothetical protein
MALIKITDIAQESGVCPICLAEIVEKLGIDTFSSRNTFDELVKIKTLPGAKQPIARNGGWIYYCDEHFEEENEEPDLEIEIEDCF